MKQAEATQRERKGRLEQLVGTQLIVKWTLEDQDLSLSDLSLRLPLRICKATKFIAATHQFVLRFKCEYEKIVEEEELFALLKACTATKERAKVRRYTQLHIRDAESEWENGTTGMQGEMPDLEQDQRAAAEERRRQELAKILKEQAVLAESMRLKQVAIDEQVTSRRQQEEKCHAAQRSAILRLQMQQAAQAVKEVPATVIVCWQFLH